MMISARRRSLSGQPSELSFDMTNPIANLLIDTQLLGVIVGAMISGYVSHLQTKRQIQQQHSEFRLRKLEELMEAVEHSIESAKHWEITEHDWEDLQNHIVPKLGNRDLRKLAVAIPRMMALIELYFHEEFAKDLASIRRAWDERHQLDDPSWGPDERFEIRDKIAETLIGDLNALRASLIQFAQQLAPRNPRPRFKRS